MPEKVASLAIPLERNRELEPEVVLDAIDVSEEQGDFAQKIKQGQILRTLFSKHKFFLNREVPKEPLTFVIRSCGGTVSWADCPANLYDESSTQITHQIVDRNIVQFDFNR